MVQRIERDQSRFREIVRGRIRQNLRKYVTHGEMIGRKGRELVSIPIPQLDLPHFRFGKNGSGGVGQGDGEEGDQVMPGDADGQGKGHAGNQPGQHLVEVEVSLEELGGRIGIAADRAEGAGEHQRAEVEVHGHSASGAGVATALQTHIQRGAAAADLVEFLRSRTTAGGADQRRQALPRVEDD
jgi:hypothetical protein